MNRTVRPLLALFVALIASAHAIGNTYYVSGAAPTIAGGTVSGTTQADADSSTTTLVLAADASPTDSAYVNYCVALTSGANASNNRKITAYVGATRTCTIVTEFSATEANIEGVTYRILRGCDSNAGGSPTPGSGSTGPFASIQKAIATAGAGSHTVNVAAATYDIRYPGYNTGPSFDTSGRTWNVQCTGGSGCYIVDNTATAGAVRIADNTSIVNMTGFDISSSSGPAVYIDGSGCDARFINCNLRHTGTVAPAVQYAGAGASTRDFSMDGGLLYGRTHGVYTTGDVGSIGFNGVTFQGDTGATNMVHTNTGSFVSMDFENCTNATVGPTTGYMLNTATSGNTLLTRYATFVRVRGCTGTWGRFMYIPSYVRNLDIADNTMTFAYNQPTILGVETVTDGDLETNAAPFNRISVRRNNFTFSAADNNHSWFMGVGANNSQIIDNRFIAPLATTDITGGHVVLKCDNATFTGNTIYCDHPDCCLELAGARWSTIVGNTVYQNRAGNSALRIDDNQDATTSGFNIVERNILCVTTGNAFAIDVGGDSGADDWYNIFDKNVYWTTGTNTANIGGTAVTVADGVAGLQTRWKAWCLDKPGRYNDTNSVIADPLFFSPSTFDFRVMSNSPAVSLNAGVGGSSVLTHQVSSTGVYFWTGE